MTYIVGPGSSVGIATDYGLDVPGSNPGGDETFRPSRPALGHTQPPVQWVPGLSRGCRRPGREADPPPHLVPKVLEKCRAIPLLTIRCHLRGLQRDEIYINIYIYIYENLLFLNCVEFLLEC